MSKTRYLHFLLLLIVGLIIYSKIFFSPFVFDDKWFIIENAAIRDLSNYILPSGTRYITFLSFAVNYTIGGYNSFGYNLVNIFIHIFNATGVYILVFLLIKTPIINKTKHSAHNSLPLMVALIFLVHPIENEAVSYVTQRFASLATFFYLLSINSYLSARLAGLRLCNHGGGRFRLYLLYGTALMTAFIAQGTKEISFTLPFIICVFEFVLFTDSNGFKSRLYRLLPFLLATAIIPAFLFMPETTGHGAHIFGTADRLREFQTGELKSLSVHNYLITQFRVLVTYIRLLVFPVNQNLLYDYPRYKSFFSPAVLISFIFLASLFSLSAYLLVRSRIKQNALGLLISLGILWFFITISVESSIVPIKHVIFEHRLYLPSIGFFIAIVAGFFYLTQNISAIRSKTFTRAGWALFAVIIITFSTLSYRRNLVWSSELNLWRDTAQKSPNNADAHNNLALAYDRAGDRKNALKHFSQAIRLDPSASFPYNNLCNLYLYQGDNERALSLCLEALRLDPSNAKAHNNIAGIYKNIGDVDRALYHYKKASKLKPFNDEIQLNMGLLYKENKEFDNAIRSFKNAIRFNPDRGLYHFALAVLYMETKDYPKARSQFKSAIRKEPSNAPARGQLATLNFQLGAYAKAAEGFKAALKINPTDDSLHFNLASTYLKTGAVELAKKHFIESIRLNPNASDAHYNLGLIYLNEKSLDKAQWEFNKTLALSPGYKAASNALKKTLRLKTRDKR